jgi:hypothetical protein
MQHVDETPLSAARHRPRGRRLADKAGVRVRGLARGSKPPLPGEDLSDLDFHLNRLEAEDFHVQELANALKNLDGNSLDHRPRTLAGVVPRSPAFSALVAHLRNEVPCRHRQVERSPAWRSRDGQILVSDDDTSRPFVCGVGA